MNMHAVKPELAELPVHAPELEECVLGAIMLEGDAMARVAAWLKPHHFYVGANAEIYAAHVDMWERGAPIDIWTTHCEMRSRGKSEETGGAYYISTLTNRVASCANVEYHGRIILQYWVQREIAKAGTQAGKKGSDGSVSAYDLAEDLEARVQAIIEEANAQGESSMREDANAILEDAASDKPPGIPTGFESLDNLIGGWGRGDLWIIAARPGMGKTSAMLACAAKCGRNVGLISLEMGKQQVGKRLQSIVTGVSFTSIYQNKCTPEELRELHAHHERFAGLPIRWRFDADNVGAIRAAVAAWVKKDKVELIMIDQLSHVQGRGQTRDQEVGFVTRNLKKIAMDNEVPIVLLHQLSRDVAKRTDKRPQLTDLRDSGNVENDADGVIFIHRPEYYGIMESDYGSTIGIAEFIVAKFRNGGPCETQLMWDGSTVSFREGYNTHDTRQPF